MPISGLVVVLREDEREANAVRESMLNSPQLQVGPSESQYRVPVVMDTETRKESKELLLDIERQPGVVHVEVVYVDFGDERWGAEG